MLEFFKTNWGILLQALIAILTIIVMYRIYRKGKCAEEEKEEKKSREDITERVVKIEASLELLTKLYPQLKALEKLENFDKLNLKAEDIREMVSDILKTTNLTPEAIETRIEEKLKKGLSKIDESTATITANILNEIDRRFEKPVASASDYLLLGNAEYFKANYSKALELLEKSIELRPDDATAWCNVGAVFAKLNRNEDALKAFEKAIVLKPDYAMAWSNKGAVFTKLDRHEDALIAFEKAINLKPGYTLAWFNKGVALGKLNRHEEALNAHEKAIELKPDYANAWYNRACIYSLKGEKEKALSDLKRAIELDISNKQQAKEDEDFKNLWDDPDFKKLVG